MNKTNKTRKKNVNNNDLFNLIFSGKTSNKLRSEALRHKKVILFRGNALDQRLFRKEFIDLIVTSPPYNVGIDYSSNEYELILKKGEKSLFFIF